jgi:hypothetical protein
VETQPHEHWKPKRSRLDYLPLIVIVLAIAQSASAGQWMQGTWDGRSFMRQFTAVFLMLFAMPKLLDLRGFADGFQMYDLIGKRFRPYALAYPFIQLGLGLAYQTNLYPVLTNSVLLVVMLIGATGVFSALHQGLDVTCDSLGTYVKVPLSTVAVVEDAGLAAMAVGMLLMGTV